MVIPLGLALKAAASGPKEVTERPGGSVLNEALGREASSLPAFTSILISNFLLLAEVLFLQPVLCKYVWGHCYQEAFSKPLAKGILYP